MYLEFHVDASTPCAVTVFYGVSVSEHDGLLSRLTSPVSYATTRTVLPAGTHQLVSQALTMTDCLDVTAFPRTALFPDKSLPWAMMPCYPVLVMLESVGKLCVNP